MHPLPRGGMPRRTARQQNRLYGDLAWTWPIVSPPEDYVDEAEEHWRTLERHARRPVRTLLHLGCGGGHLDRSLKRHCALTGVDVSPAMLGLAKGLNPAVTYAKGDMRTARLGRTFDAVLIADSIAYMCTESDLLAAFRTAFAHLRPGGAFLTYVEQTPETFREGRSTSVVRTRGGTEITFLENLHDPDPRDTTFESRFLYLIREGGRLRIERDLHTCGIFPLAAWERLLRRAGFQPLRVANRDQGQHGEAVVTFVGLRPATRPRPSGAVRPTAGRRRNSRRRTAQGSRRRPSRSRL